MMKVKTGDYNVITSDRDIFNQIVYTPLSEALKLLDERRKDKKLVAKVEKLLKGDVPEVLKNKKCGIFARHIASPNKESVRFMSIAKENNLYPVFFEYYDDKFTSNNDSKHSLGQIRVHDGPNKKGNYSVEKINIIDMVKYDGKKLKEIVTLWGEPLINFHRKLFKHYKLSDDLGFYDLSEWYKRNGGKASEYYTNLLLLFTTYGILFENFLPDGKEEDFSKTILLPSIQNVVNLTGIKPLIVPLGPIDSEGEEYWISHPPEIKSFLSKK